MFEPLYAEGTPLRLSLGEFLEGVVCAGLSVLGPTARTAALTVCWLVALPIATIRVSRLFWDSPLGHQGLGYNEAAEYDRTMTPVFYSPWDTITTQV